LVHHTLAILSLGTMLSACAKGNSPDADWTNASQEGGADGGDLLTLDPDTGTPSGGGILGDCHEVTTKINGRRADDALDPTVGDEWIVLMYCDGAVVTGANILQFSPPNVAHVHDINTIAEFLAPGDATMKMQAGNLVYTKNITVAANE
jgi:hypothetical protein